MSRRGPARSAGRGGVGGGSLDLIHRNKVPEPASMRVCGEVELVRYGLEWGVSQAVIEAAFQIALALHRGAYAKST